jgi:hypothetical protein
LETTLTHTDKNDPVIQAQLDIFIGGASDGKNRIVAGYWEDVWKNKVDRDSEYFTWTQKRAIISRIESWCKLFPKTQINIMAHSYGADTACWVVSDLVRFKSIQISRLFTFDPVSMLRPNLSWVRRGTEFWANVVADPEKPGAHDLIAICGGKWWDFPSETADRHIRVPCNHEDFTGMMEAPLFKDGTNATTFLLGSGGG